MYAFLADVIVGIHLGFVLFVLLGQILILVGLIRRWKWVRNFWFRVAHLASIGVIAYETLLGIECPLTVWEYYLRQSAGQSPSESSFIGGLLHNILFVEAPQSVLNMIYLIFAGTVVGTFLLGPPRLPGILKRRKRRKPEAQAASEEEDEIDSEKIMSSAGSASPGKVQYPTSVSEE